MTLYQAYAWEGDKYTCISVPKKTPQIARREALIILTHPYPECCLGVEVHKHWKEKEILIKEIKYD